MFAVAAVVVAELTIWFVSSREPSAHDATWRVDPSFTPQATSVEILVRVQEATCSSGKPATGRIKVDVSYSASAVTIDISVKPLDGDNTCQAVETLYAVRLREPLGDRELVDANS